MAQSCKNWAIGRRPSPCRRNAQQFIAAIRGVLGAKADDASVVWFAPGQLLVFGTKELHTKTEKLLRELADADAGPQAAIAALHKITAKRFADRKPQAERMAKAKRLSTLPVPISDMAGNCSRPPQPGHSIQRP